MRLQTIVPIRAVAFHPPAGGLIPPDIKRGRCSVTGVRIYAAELTRGSHRKPCV